MLTSAAAIASMLACAALTNGIPDAAAVAKPLGAIATDHPLATAAAEEMLRQGGNAVDAAVAASFTLSVVRPFACGIGGGGFMIIYLPPVAGGEPTAAALNYRETAPRSSSADMYTQPGMSETASQRGPKAAAIPGTVRGLLDAHERFGKLSRDKVIGPSIAAATNGFNAEDAYMRAYAEAMKTLSGDSALKTGSKFLFEQLLARGELKLGDLIRNPAHAEALKLIVPRGTIGFYSGPIAEAIVASTNGHITLEDLAGYRSQWLKPLAAERFGCQILTMPPPSSGGVALLQITDWVPRGTQGATDRESLPYLSRLTESMKFAFADRAIHMADPKFTEVPVAKLLSQSYLDIRAKTFPTARTMHPEFYTISEEGEQLGEDGGTSHISILDGQGGAVACTETINLNFGSFVEVAGFGFLLNDQMDDFTTSEKPNAFGLTQSKRNAPEPGKQPLSSMTPTLAIRDGKPVLAAGGAGGPRIISATTQVVLNVLMFKMPAASAVSAWRIHHQWKPNELLIEKKCAARHNGLSIPDWMAKLGHKVERTDAIAGVNLVTFGPDGFEAAADERRGGAASVPRGTP